MAKRVHRAAGLVALGATTILATAGLTAPDQAGQTATAQAAAAVAAWPIHVALAAVAVAAVWLPLLYGAKRDTQQFETAKLNAQAVGKVADAMMAMRDVEAQRAVEMARLSAAIESRPCLHGVTEAARRTRVREKGEGDEPESDRGTAG